jgi:hypothetical protein
VKRITRQQAELIAVIHDILQGDYGEESRVLLHDRLLAWAAEELKRRPHSVSNESRKKNASSGSARGKKKNKK